GLVARVADYEKTIVDLRQSTEQQRAAVQNSIDQQTTKIAVLNGEVDTLSHVSAALSDTVGRLTTEVNTAYYIVGTKDELLKKGIIVAEGPKRFLVVARAGARARSEQLHEDRPPGQPHDRSAGWRVPDHLAAESDIRRREIAEGRKDR